MQTPTVSIDTDGVVTWDEVTGATGYEISFDNTIWTVATSGSETIDKSSTGDKTAYVRATSTNSNYNSPSDAGNRTVTVYSLGLNKGTGIAQVTGAGNYVNGKEVTIGATINEGYTWNTWSVESGNSPVALASATTTITITQNTILNAVATENPIKYPSGKTAATAEVGDDLEIGDEKFKIVSKSDTKIRALAYYNITLTTDNPIQSRTGYGTSYLSYSDTFNSFSSGDIDMNDSKVYIKRYLDAYEDVIKLHGAADISVDIVRKSDLKPKSYWLTDSSETELEEFFYRKLLDRNLW